MRHTNPYHPPDYGEAQQQLAVRVFAPRVSTSVSITSISGNSYTAASSAPGSPVPGDRWLELTSGVMFTYVNDGNSSQWVEL